MSSSVARAQPIRRSVVGALACALVLAGCGQAGRSTVPGCPPLAVPAYAVPTSRMWTEIRASGAAVRWVIINPSNGPGTHAMSGYRHLVTEARLRGERVLGYIPTGQGQRGARALLAQVDKYQRWYGVTGIFFDEVPTSRRFEPLYRRLVDAVHAGHGVAVLNPGVLPAAGYFAFADAVVTFEASESRYERPSTRVRPTAPVARRKIWAIVLGAPRRDLSKVVDTATARGTGALFVTNRDGGNPYDRLPSYWSSETRLATSSCGSGGGRSTGPSRKADPVG